MKKDKAYILCTAHLDEPLKEKVEASGIDMDIIPLIQINPVVTEVLAKDISAMMAQNLHVVFTSARAVEAIVNGRKNIQHNWKIYCVGNATRNTVVKYFGEGTVVGIADNATNLANEIIHSGNIKEVTFFCGDIHRDELPGKLRGHNIEVNEVVVYQTITTTLKIDKEYDGILFFSPSAVSSFFAGNTISPDTVLFAIGDTTAMAIKSVTSNKIVVSNKPGKEEVVDLMTTYFVSN